MALALPACADQLQVGHSWSSGETTTATKFNDSVNKATAKPGLIGEQTQSTDAVVAADELLLRRAADNALVRISVAQLIPPGVVQDFAGTAVPSGWLLCDGRAVSRTTYAALFTALGTTYGAGDSSTTFNLPDTRGRVVAGIDVTVSAAYADRLTATGTGNPNLNSRTLGAAGGVDRWTLLLTQIPSHFHGFAIPAFTEATNGQVGGNSYRIAGVSWSATSTAATGGGQAHPTVPPTIVLNKIIKY